MDVELTAVEARVLGSLLEKERTVPATYPLTMNALLTACNQATSRDPVMDVSERDAEAAIESLKARKLVRRVLASHGARTTKYRQVADEVWALDDAQRAVITVLLLRGPQTVVELRTRTERLHPFADVEQVEATLADMAAWGDPLVRLLPKAPGQRDARWAHLLSGEPDATAGHDRPSRSGPAPALSGDDGPPPDPALLGPLVALVGRWTGGGDGRYPTIDDFGYAEQIEIQPLAGKPILSYQSRTRSTEDGRALHAESGWIRLAADGSAEMVVAAAPGLVEACSGIVEVSPDGIELVLASSQVVGTPTAVAVTATERTYRVDNRGLTYTLAMASTGHPLTPHLTATLHRT